MVTPALGPKAWAASPGQDPGAPKERCKATSWGSGLGLAPSATLPQAV